MQTVFLPTCVGTVAVHIRRIETDKLPVIFLHGVYFDHRIWDTHIQQISDRTCIAIDMPLHGESRGTPTPDFTLADCATMALEILDALHISRAIAVGHSWGAMTLLRAAHRSPGRFAAIALCNMPLHAATAQRKATFTVQHALLRFRAFYTRQAARALFGKTQLRENPHLFQALKSSMDLLSTEDIKRIDQIVVLDAEDATEYVLQLKVPAIGIKGAHDYVPSLPGPFKTHEVPGGHISPIEAPQHVHTLLLHFFDQPTR
jgi:pimeloyl-ACP methyl ester carboxylesterase